MANNIVEKTNSRPSHRRILNLLANKEMPVKTNVCQKEQLELLGNPSVDHTMVNLCISASFVGPESQDLMVCNLAVPLWRF